jgi:hypothetical protein
MLARIIITGAGTGKVPDIFPVGFYFYGVNTIVPAILGLPKIGACFL